MKIVRTRYVPEQQAFPGAADGWIEVARYEEAEVVQLEDFRGSVFQLQVPATDPWTLDAGTFSLEMVGASASAKDGFSWTGFVSRQDLEYEAAYFNYDSDRCADARDRDDLAGMYVREEWRAMSGMLE